MKKVLSYILIIISLVGFLGPIRTTQAQEAAPGNPSSVEKKVNTNTIYTPLAPLPNTTNETCEDKTGKKVPCLNTVNTCAFGKYLNAVIKLVIGMAAVLAVVMIVVGGIEYMTSELISSKQHGKERILNALLGLVIALGAYALLNTINPKLLEVCLDKDTLQPATVEIKITTDETKP